MNVLGVHGALQREDEEFRRRFIFHDAAAALLRDGEVIAAVEEERLSRLKHANAFPLRAIEHCLASARLSFDDIDLVAINRLESAENRAAIMQWLLDPTHEEHSDGRSLIGAAFSRAFGVDVRSKLVFCPHHVAHAWSAFAPSGFDEALVLVVDGDAEDRLSGVVMVGRGDDLVPVREYGIEKSLGSLYCSVIALLGFRRFDEYKAMGLAPYGDAAAYEELFQQGYQLLPGGDYTLAPVSDWWMRFHAAGLVQEARRPGQPFRQVHMDLAAALQRMLERVLLHILTYHRQATGQRRVCLAGGVAHNCSANGAVLYSGLFDDVFVQPASHDAGCAVGAAIHATRQRRGTVRKTRWTHVYLGRDLGDCDAIRRQLEPWSAFVDVEPLGDSVEIPAQLLADGAVIGWAQGRAEFGPRALGNRSILADARPASNKARINDMVKKREAFRPFAPAVLAERARDYFELPSPESEFPFMVFVVRVRPEMRERLGAITHVDGTARIQTVAREDNPRFWSLLAAFARRTGVGVLLNTSFNHNAEPIVDTVDDALTCFLTTALDYVVVGNWLLRKKSAELGWECFERLVPELPPFRRLVRRRTFDARTGDFLPAYVMESTRSYFFGPVEVPLSDESAAVLLHADGRRTLHDLWRLAGGGPTETLRREIDRLWRDRIILMRPPSHGAPHRRRQAECLATNA